MKDNKVKVGRFVYRGSPHIPIVNVCIHDYSSCVFEVTDLCDFFNKLE